ncbi:MAG TPA: glycosyltransferase, partial [Gemmataceae bacterium]|nr:glycosyltransferase [Gemmataceae bacterium]
MTRADNPAVSVIIATCDRPELLLDCVASILANDFDDFEVVVIDQEPSRLLRQCLAERFPGEARVRYLFVDRAGASRARNEGVRQARGRILVFADDDVEVDRGWLRAYVETFAARPAPGLVQGRLSPRWPAGPPAWLPEEKYYLLGLYDRDGEARPLPQGDGAITANCAVLREAVAHLPQLFDERVGPSYARGGLLTGEDTLLSVKVRQAGYEALYQPAARAWHKISAAKLAPRAFLRRNFWDGATLLT